MQFLESQISTERTQRLKVEIAKWCRHSWLNLFLFLWNRPGKKQEGTRKIFIESTNAHFLHAMETLYVTVSEERRGSPAELFQAKSLLWYQLFWGRTCTLGESKERDRHWVGVRSIRSGEKWIENRCCLPHCVNFAVCIAPEFLSYALQTHTLGWPWHCPGHSAPPGFCLLPGISENSAWHLLWKES